MVRLLILPPLLAVAAVFAFSSLQATVELIVLLDHRYLDSEGSARDRYRALAIAQHAGDKGSGVFGHAWIWLYGRDNYGRFWNEELGHTGESDATLPTYLDQLLACAKRSAKEGDHSVQAIEILKMDRFDGALQHSHGGHLPQLAFGIELSDQQLSRLRVWLESDCYQFKRYNLSNHHCCHFALECLAQVGLHPDRTPTYRLPSRISVAGECFQLYSDPSYASFALLTPWQLGENLKGEGMSDRLALYYEIKERYSRWPWVRAWQRRANLQRLVLFAWQQLQREMASFSWVEESLKSSAKSSENLANEKPLEAPRL